MNVSDDQKRWAAFGFALNKVLVEKIRPFVKDEIRKEYESLQTRRNIHTQNYLRRLQRHTVVLKYENINGNDTIPRRDGGKYDYSKFNYQVTSYIDFAKLYVEKHMAKFNAFNEDCDASAVLTLLNKVPVFPFDVQIAAGEVKKARNSWAHCAFSKWNPAGFEQSFADMEQLVKSLGLPSADETAIFGELNDWKNKGNLYYFFKYPLI